MRRTLSLAAALLAAVPAHASDWFLIQSTHEDQASAWRAATAQGGWVLDHDLYDGLRADRWSVVRGPFPDDASTRKVMRALQRQAGYESAYVKEAGGLRLPGPLLAPGAPPIALAALLGEIEVSAVAVEPGSGPCAPDVPSWEVRLRARDQGDGAPASLASRDLALPGALLISRDTGEVRHRLACEPPPPPPPEPPPCVPAPEAPPPEP